MKKFKPVVKLLARSVMKSSADESFLLIKYSSLDLGMTKLIIPTNLLNKSHEFFSLLISKGFPANLDKSARKQVIDELCQSCENTFTLSKKPGFVDDAYISPSGKIWGSETKYGPIIKPEYIKNLPMVVKKSNLKNWQDNIAIYALHSSRLMLGLCSAFSPFLLKDTGIESGGFHFFGMSSVGKSTILFFSASVYGNFEYVDTLKLTEKATQELAQAHNDALLCLDELKLADPNPKKAAEKIQGLIYLLSSGRGTKYSKNYEKQEGTDEWRIVFLSAGERSLKQHAADGGISRLEGEEARVIDISADTGSGHGIFETIPMEVGSSSELVQNIAVLCNQYHGSAQYAFLKKYVSRRKTNPKKMAQYLNQRIEFFLKKHDVDKNNGVEIRTAKRFALAYAAGALAARYKVLPFDKKEVMKGISRCYQDARAYLNEGIVKPVSKVVRIPDELLQLLSTADVVDLDKDKSLSNDEINKFAVFKKKIDGVSVFAVKSDVLKGIEPDRRQLRLLLEHLAIKGILLRDAAGKNTRTVRKGIGRRYCFINTKI
ncbi:TPA: DUF927 domain-containing protein [Proteus mirabilis]|nr:DUF927 domain-containing protein [Proteus mirabilis]